MTATYADALRELSEPRPVGDLVKSAIGRAARVVDLPYWRTFDIWYGKARRIDDQEARRIEQALQHKREQAARNEIHDLRARLLRIESRVAAQGADVRRPRLNLTREPDGGYR